MDTNILIHKESSNSFLVSSSLKIKVLRSKSKVKNMHMNTVNALIRTIIASFDKCFIN